MNRLSLLLVHGTQVGPFVQQQLHHLRDFKPGKVFSCLRSTETSAVGGGKLKKKKKQPTS